MVRAVFEKLSLYPVRVDLGEVELTMPLAEGQTALLDTALAELGFERIDDRKSRQIEEVKRFLLEIVETEEPLRHNLSVLLSEQFHLEYSGISKLFSEVEGIALEKYFILLKLEKAKEWLVYGDLTLSEIAHRLHYSSLAHFSRQFKQVTGFPPSHFRQVQDVRRRGLDELVQNPEFIKL